MIKVQLFFGIPVFAILCMASLCYCARFNFNNNSTLSPFKYKKSSGKLNMSMAPIVIGGTSCTAAMIFLHGLGDTGYGWSSAIEGVRTQYLKVVCPTAPSQAVTLNMGIHMPAWFDIVGLEATSAEDAVGIKSSAGTVHNLIESQIKAGIPSERIILGGFSQGGALALYAGLTFPKKLAGIVGLSCWLPLHKNFPKELVTANRNIPIFQGHGDCDPIVSYNLGQMTASALKQFTNKGEFKTYTGMMHSSTPQELSDMKAFIQRNVPEL